MHRPPHDPAPLNTEISYPAIRRSILTALARSPVPLSCPELLLIVGYDTTYSPEYARPVLVGLEEEGQIGSLLAYDIRFYHVVA